MILVQKGDDMFWHGYEIIEQVEVERLYTLFKLKFQKGKNFLGEMHDFWEVVYVVDGEVIISADENVHHFKAGDIIFHKPLELHKFNVVGENGATLFVVSFDMSGDLCKNMEHQAVHLDAYGRSLIDGFLEYVEDNVRRCPQIISKESFSSILCYFKDDNIFLQTVANYIKRIVLSLAHTQSCMPNTKTYETKLFRRALKTMNDRISEQLTVECLADELNMSVSSLKRLFDKYAGMSIHKYFLTLKIKKATVMLKHGMSVSEVSDKLGFSSQGYFSATYKRETGKNPSQI